MSQVTTGDVKLIPKIQNSEKNIMNSVLAVVDIRFQSLWFPALYISVLQSWQHHFTVITGCEQSADVSLDTASGSQSCSDN